MTSGKISCELPYCQEGRPHEAAWSEVVHSPSWKRDSSPQMKGRGLQGQVKTGSETKSLPPTRAHPGQIKRWKPNHSQVRLHHRILRTGSVFANFDSLFIENSLRIPVRTKDREARVKGHESKNKTSKQTKSFRRPSAHPGCGGLDFRDVHQGQAAWAAIQTSPRMDF